MVYNLYSCVLNFVYHGTDCILSQKQSCMRKSDSEMEINMGSCWGFSPPVIHVSPNHTAPCHAPNSPDVKSEQ